jgi:hypothetical protein
MERPMIVASKCSKFERGSVTLIEAVVTMSIGLLFAVGALLFQQHTADIVSRDKCVTQKIAELDDKGQPMYNLSDPDLLSKMDLVCPKDGQ